MYAAASTPLIVFEVLHLPDIQALESLVKSEWSHAADALDAWCSDRERFEQRVQDCYFTTRQLGGMLGRMASSPTEYANRRIYCSADPDLKHITGIAIARFCERSCILEFAVSHPENISVPGLQAKARNGSVAVLLQHLVTSRRDCKIFSVDATHSGRRLFERVGFVVEDEAPSGRFLTQMYLVQEKIDVLLARLSFDYHVETLPFRLTDW